MRIKEANNLDSGVHPSTIDSTVEDSVLASNHVEFTSHHHQEALASSHHHHGQLVHHQGAIVSSHQVLTPTQHAILSSTQRAVLSSSNQAMFAHLTHQGAAVDATMDPSIDTSGITMTTHTSKYYLTHY